MTSVASTDPLPFRTRILHGEFNAIQEGDPVWTTVMPEFVKMYPLDSLFMQGHVFLILERESDGERIVVVKNELGRWSFTKDGLSLNKICKLSVNRIHGQLLCLYEPVFHSWPPPTERGFEKEPIEPKTARRELVVPGEHIFD